MKVTQMIALLCALLMALVCSPAARADWMDAPAGYKQVVPQSTKRNHVFYADESVSFTFATSPVSSTNPLTLVNRFELRDYYGTLISQGAVNAPTLSLGTLPLGWFKLYLYGAKDWGAPWGTAVGATNFCVFRRDSHFPDPPAPGTSGGSLKHDGIVRGYSALGPQRHDASDYLTSPSNLQTRLDNDIAIDRQWYLNYPDAARSRKLLMTFASGTTDSAAVSSVVNRYKGDVKYFEPRNEPQGAPPNYYLQSELLPFRSSVKSAGSDLKVVGPGVVSIASNGLGWLEEFLARGGAQAIDAYSFHAYNAVNGDLHLARRNMEAHQALLERYGADKTHKEQWQTEQGYAAPNYGVYEPRHQGRWIMMQRMVFEQYGIPKEQDHYWYDTSHGFWNYPMYFKSGEYLHPVIPLMRVYSEELWGKTFQSALDFGPVDNKRFIGNVFSGAGGTVTVLMSAGSTPGRAKISGASSATDAFGNPIALNASGGFIDVPELPIYIHSSVTVSQANYGPNWALLPGVSLSTNGDSAGLNKLNNGTMDSWYVTQTPNGSLNGPDAPWNAGSTHSPSASAPVTVEITLPTAKPIGRIHIFATPPHQGQTSLLDYDLQYWDGNAWQLIERVQEPTKTFPYYTASVRCSMDSFYSDRWVFEHTFAPVTTNKIRLLVRDVTSGGYATAAANAAGNGAEGGGKLLVLREIELYANAPEAYTISGNVKNIAGPTPVNYANVTVNLSGDATRTATTDANGNYSFANVPSGGNYAVSATKGAETFAPVSRRFVNLASNRVVNFANPNGDGLEGNYYSTRDFNNLLLTRHDADLDFNWGGGSPGVGIGTDNFSVRWTGYIQPLESGTYQLITKTDDSVKLWIDGQLLVDDSAVTGYREHPLTLTLNAYQKYKLQLDYQEAGGTATARLHWRTPSMAASDPDEAIPAPQLYLPPARGSGNGLKAEYFDNDDFTNRKILRIDSRIANDYGTGSPDASIAPDTFSVRWTGFIQSPVTGSCKFQVLSDEKLRVWMGNNLVMDDWTPHTARWSYATVAMQAGELMPIKIEYADITGNAVIKLYWDTNNSGASLVPQSQLYSGDDGSGLSAQYFNQENFTAKFAEKVDPQISFDWGTKAPLANMNSEHFSVRWTGKVKPWFSETYTFSTLTDERVRLWVNGQLLIDNWNAHEQTNDSGTIALQAGQLYDIRMEYADVTWKALAQLYWSSPGTPNQIIPAWQLYPVPPGFTLSGNVKDITGSTPVNFANVTIKLTGTATRSTTTDANGNYAFSGLPEGGNYVVSAEKSGQRFTPASRQFNNLITDQVANFANPNGDGLEGNYYSTRDFNNLLLTRHDANLDFDWGSGTPYPGLGDVSKNNFSIRWTGYIQPIESGTYTLITKTDDSVKLWLDDQVLVDDSATTGYREHPLTLTLNAFQKYKLQLDYQEAGGAATARLHWRTPSMAASDLAQAIPTPQLYLPPARGSGNGLKAEYFDNEDFTNRKILRLDSRVNNDYGTGSPDASIAPDTFSVRWTGFVQATATGSYPFQVLSDEKVRVWIGGNLVIDDWTPHTARWSYATVAMQAGALVPIKIEYADITGAASVKLYWKLSGDTYPTIIPQSQLYSGDDGTGLSAQYFNQEDFTEPFAQRLDPQISFDWGNAAALPGMNADHFSVRWSGQVKPWFSETYTFSTLTDERVKLWVNGQLLIDNWNAHSRTNNAGTIALQAGQLYDIRMDYADVTGDAAAQLYWSSPSTPNQLIPAWLLYPQVAPPPSASSTSASSTASSPPASATSPSASGALTGTFSGGAG